MADIRIKDLTTTASSSASDDFIAVDGTTNGTRKLNAFSPTFGGNATVTGTLSSAGNLSVTGTSAQIILGQSSGSALTYLIRPAQAGGAIQIVQDSATVNRWLSLGGADNLGVYSELLRVAGATGNILVTSTVASTTTSSGALVVGNGTSGGLGVGGAINAGGNIAIASGNSLRLYNSGNTAYISVYNFNERLNINYPTSLIDTTASTSTSSGALVVSGGVGVAGAVNVGGNLSVTGTMTVSGDQNSFFSGSWPRMFFTTNGASTWLSGATTGASTVQHDFQNRSTTSLLTLYGTGNAIFAGNIKTAAPAGGTAAEWKLGTVASVSPTSPNRTIEVDIGGTIYYIHAKTTNN